MPDIKLKDKSGIEKTYTNIESVALLDVNGNEVEFYEASKFDNYYTKSETYNQKQIDTAIVKASLQSRSNWTCDDMGNSQYIQNRTHFDSRQTAISAVVDLEDDTTVTFRDYKLRKISDKILTNTTEIIKVDGQAPETVKPMYADTTVTLRTTSGTIYSLNWNAVSVFMNALTTMPIGHIFQAWSYVTPVKINSDGTINQDYLDENEKFAVIFCFVREGNVLTKDADGAVATLDTGTYIGFDAQKATDVAGATATITYGRLQKLDEKYLDLSGLYTKAEVDNIVKKAIQSVLPPYTSSDNGKVLGIQNGTLAWIKVGTSPDPGGETTVELTSVGSAVQSGNYVEIT